DRAQAELARSVHRQRLPLGRPPSARVPAGSRPAAGREPGGARGVRCRRRRALPPRSPGRAGCLRRCGDRLGTPAWFRTALTRVSREDSRDAYSIRGMAWGTVELEPEVRDWLEGLSATQFATAAFYVDLLVEHGTLLGEPYTRQFGGKLRELRFHL